MYVCVFMRYAGAGTCVCIYKYVYVCMCIYNAYLTEIKCSFGVFIYLIFQGWKERFPFLCAEGQHTLRALG